ncbi:MAG: trimethylamine methyltransferase family protein [Proteobacteria bacterium]|nr:trimethylamine methyltransferase family protein [Pseudomonadota bacterium]MBU1585424.1 trimethylamine methyltransferase family protein [Pseudomonadota bacterium]MBU2454643.1 trimethylamine methyltransferase family protein [Pseudomonadota bacterium]MBU2630258.1 trimethylamine methyltransferase family protein [Pseudomonadota bacterium]
MSDVQTGHEKTLTGLIPALAGANMIYGSGMLESGITFDYGQLVLDCEFARMIKHTIQGIPVNDETLAIDPIKEIGPGKDYLMHKHTFKHMRSQSSPELIDRKMRGTWEKAGATTAYDRAMVKVRYILENHTPEPLSDEVLLRIRSIVSDTEKEMGIKP